jgi:NAD(P)-dependent dehydrogenase (short-subunit alcohol dehydrogenase family)
MSLAGRVAIITGASSGIGAAAARAFAAEGIIVVVAARRRERLDQLVGEIAARGGTAVAVTTDVTSDDDVQNLIDTTLTHFKRIDIVICNAGAGHYGSLEQTTPDDMARLMDLNYMGTFLVARAALPHLKRQPDAHLQIMSSIVGQRGLAYGGAYAATKFAQVGLAESLRAELLGTSVHVSVICPVSTETEFREAMEREQGFAVSGHGPRQSADFVARAMVRCLKHPKAEVYPHRLSRALVILNALFPGLCDRVVKRFGRKPLPDAPAATATTDATGAAGTTGAARASGGAGAEDRS